LHPDRRSKDEGIALESIPVIPLIQKFGWSGRRGMASPEIASETIDVKIKRVKKIIKK